MNTDPLLGFPPTWRNVFLALLGIFLFWGSVLWFKLTPAVIASLITYGATRNLANKLALKKPALRHPEGLALTCILLVMALLLSVLVILIADTRQRPGTFANLFEQMAHVLEQVRYTLPGSISAYIPPTMDSLREEAIHLLNKNAERLQMFGSHTLRGIGYVLAGIVIGALMVIQLSPLKNQAEAGHTLSWQLHRFFLDMVACFVEVVFAQFKIAALNACLTGIFLLVVMPLLGKPLPMAATLVAVTFFTGLIPIIGNLISNTVIVIISASLSITDAILALVWLMLIHKLEYFLNAQIIGTHIRARAWELLMVMLFMEATFGIAGLLCAPVIYAQIKHELSRHGWLPE